MVANGQTVNTYTMTQMLKRLNPKLKVCSFGDNGRLAGIYIIENNEWVDLCGVDKQYVPAYATFDDGGHIVKSGWRRVLWILLTHKYTNRAAIRAVCPGFFDSRACEVDRFTGGIQGDPIQNKILKYAETAPVQRWKDPDTGKIEEGTALTDDQNLEIAEDIRKKDSDQQKETREQEKWFLETWKERGGNPTDKPHI